MPVDVDPWRHEWVEFPDPPEHDGVAFAFRCVLCDIAMPTPWPALGCLGPDGWPEFEAGRTVDD